MYDDVLTKAIMVNGQHLENTETAASWETGYGSMTDMWGKQHLVGIKRKSPWTLAFLLDGIERLMTIP